MGINLKNIFHDNEDELVVNRSKNAIRALIIMSLILVFVIIIVLVIQFLGNNNSERIRQIIQDTKIIQGAVENLSKQYRINPTNTKLVGKSLNDNPVKLAVNGIEEEYRYGYYLVTPEEISGLTNALNFRDQYYIVNYDTYDVVNYYGVKYNKSKYYAIEDLLMIEKGMQPVQRQIIRTVADLEKIRANPNGHFKLSGNLDLSTYNLGEGWKPIEQFGGILDGRGYTISNVTISRPSTDKVGFFGKLLGTAKITNITFENVNINGGEYVGTLAGDGAGNISNVYVMGGTVIGQRNYTGGLVGSLSNGTISNCIVKLDSINGNEIVGGLVGNLYYGTVSKSGARDGTIIGRQTVGGAIGLASVSNATYIQEVAAEMTINGNKDLGGLIGKIEVLTNNKLDFADSYAKGTIEARSSNNTGGLVGSVSSVRDASIAFKSLYTTVDILEKNNTSGGCIGYTDISVTSSISITDCFWEKDLAPGEDLRDIGTKASNTFTLSFDNKSYDEMRIRNTFVNWNFDIWGIEERKDTPYLRWQT